jgi:O-antigen biosynthesis protein WbqP
MHQQLTGTSAQTDEPSGVHQMQKSDWALTDVSYLKRAFDLILAFLLFPVLCILMSAIAIGIRLTSDGPILYWSDRVGLRNKMFAMPKFRTMKLGAPEVATHLLPDPQRQLTVLGPLLRKTSLDELPQIYSILKGDLSFVGPRPALHNQKDLISLRTELGIHELVPGLTGWAQIHGRDQLSIPAKVEFDYEYLQNRTFWLDLKILALTAVNVLRREGVSH